mgnify:CR=1 FL=1
MKKIFLASIALLSVMIFASCSEDTTPAQKAEGKYMVKRETNMVNLPAQMPFTPLSDLVTLVVKATSDNHGSITIPSTTYLMMGNEMTIPAFTIPNVPMLDDMENGTFIPTHQFVIDGDHQWRDRGRWRCRYRPNLQVRFYAFRYQAGIRKLV